MNKNIKWVLVGVLVAMTVAIILQDVVVAGQESYTSVTPTTTPVAVVTTTTDVYQDTFRLIAEITQSIEDDTVQIDQIDNQIDRLGELKQELQGYINEQKIQKDELLDNVDHCLELKCNQ